MTPERLATIREALADQPVTNGALGWAHDLLAHIDATETNHKRIQAQALREAAALVDVEGSEVDWEETTYGAGRRHAADELEALADELDPENGSQDGGPHE